MAYSDNFPNSWKDGYSSSDDPDRVDYSPAGWERAQREGMRRSEQRERAAATSRFYDDLRKKERDEIAANIARREEDERKEKQQIQDGINRNKAEAIIVNQQYRDYMNKSWLGKAIAKLRGKSFKQMESQIRRNAEKEVAAMSSREVEQFLEENYVKKGR